MNMGSSPFAKPPRSRHAAGLVSRLPRWAAIAYVPFLFYFCHQLSGTPANGCINF
jgi:hypothetical protein